MTKVHALDRFVDPRPTRRRISSLFAVWVMVVGFAGAASVAAARSASDETDAVVHVLRRTERGFALEGRPIRAGEELELVSDTKTGIVTVILPPGPGGSASIERLAEGTRFVVRHDGDAISVVVHGADGSRHEMPRRLVRDLRAEDRRVCVTGQDGRHAAFVLHGLDTILVDEVGPVLDPFAGRVPLAPGDHVVFTRTMTRFTGTPPRGDVALTSDGGYLFAEVGLPDREPATFVVDFGAGGTLAARSFLPDDVALEPVERIEHSAQGTRKLAYAVGGATGDVGGFLGAASVPELRVGSIPFADAPFTVLESLPALAGRPIQGILGMDLLLRAEVVSFVMGGDGVPASLRFGEGEERAGEVVPISLVGRNLYLKGGLGETTAHFVLDTGSPRSFLQDRTAEAAGLAATSSETRTVHGLDGVGATVVETVVPELRLGDGVHADVPFETGDLAVFQTIGTGQNPGLLGTSFWRRFRRVTIDQHRMELRLER